MFYPRLMMLFAMFVGGDDLGASVKVRIEPWPGPLTEWLQEKVCKRVV